MKDIYIKKKKLRKLQPAWDRERLKEGIVFQAQHLIQIQISAPSPCILVINKKEKLIRIRYTSAEEYSVPSNQSG